MSGQTLRQAAQLADARAKAHSPTAQEKRRQTMLARWRESPEAFDMSAMRTPEARRKAGLAARRPLADRFAEKVERADGGCWNWTGSKNAQGYGFIADRTGAGKKLRATHVALELSGRPRPANALALHSCDNPQCVNPDHLRWGTPKDNVRDCIERGRFSAPPGRGVRK